MQSFGNMIKLANKHDFRLIAVSYYKLIGIPGEKKK
jgi:hypothetical protein